MIPDAVTGSPVKYPSVKLGGVEYTLKFSVLAEFIADDLRLNLREFFNGLRGDNVGTLAGFLKLFSAMVAHNFVALGQPVPKPEHWAAVLDREEPSKTAEVCQAVGECLQAKMLASAKVRLQEPAPSQGPQPN